MADSLRQRIDTKRDAEEAGRVAAQSNFGLSRQTTRVMPPSQPCRCPNCDRPFRKAPHIETTRRILGLDDPPPSYRANAHLVQERWYVGFGFGPDHGPGARVEWDTWDGESYREPAGPFCTTRCAAEHGIWAYRKGWRP